MTSGVRKLDWPSRVGDADPAPPRPATWEEFKARFSPQPALNWLDPRVLMASLRLLLLSGLFARFADKREILAARPDSTFDASEVGFEQDLWLDFVADVGDGFGATYAVAQTLAEARLEVPTSLPDSSHTRSTRRGSILFMGGDEVYPYATQEAYKERTVGPYTAALPPGSTGAPPYLFALPGNHDWYDGLTSFLRQFCSGASIGAWRTVQERSYFAVRLRRNCWLWAIDSQFDTYLDTPQLEYFDEAGEQLRERCGADPAPPSVILLTAKPSWTKVTGEVMGDGTGDRDGKARPEAPQSWQTLAFFISRYVESKGATVPVVLTGDAHHYARYEASNATGTRHLFTSGGGGAALSATHGLPNEVGLPSYRQNAGLVDEDRTWFRRACAWPDREDSKRIARSLLRRPISARSTWFSAVVAGLYLLLSVVGAVGAGGHVSAIGGSGVGGAVAAGLFAIAFVLLMMLPANPPKHWSTARRGRSRSAGAAHGALHVLAAGALTFGALELLETLHTEDGAPAGLVVIGAAILVGLAGFWVGPTLFGTYWVAGNWKDGTRFDTELFGALSDEEGRGYKNFLRLHLDEAGRRLTVYPVGIHATPRHDEIEIAPAESEEWLQASHPIEVELIEAPIEIDLAADRG